MAAGAADAGAGPVLVLARCMLLGSAQVQRERERQIDG